MSRNQEHFLFFLYAWIIPYFSLSVNKKSNICSIILRKYFSTIVGRYEATIIRDYNSTILRFYNSTRSKKKRRHEASSFFMLSIF